MKVAGLVGSLRKGSFNQQIANFIQNRYKDEMDIEYLNIENLPFFNQDQEENPPEVVKIFKKSILESDAVLIVTPEYNHSVPGILKNALDWLSRVDKVLTGKPVLIVGATTGMLGTVRCQIHLRQILASPGLSAKVLPGNEVLIGLVHQKLDENGKLIDEPTIAFIDATIANFKAFVLEIVPDNKVKDLIK